MSGDGHDAVALEAADDVATALRALAAGDVARVRTARGTVAVRLREDVPLCHKLALRDLAAGERVRKHGEVIGEASAAIARGAHVHVHNLRSLRGRAA